MSAGSRVLVARTTTSGSMPVGQVDVRGLSVGVHAGVGAAGPGHGDRAACQWRERLLERRLDRRTVLLALPARVRRAVVRHAQQDARHATSGRASSRA